MKEVLLSRLLLVLILIVILVLAVNPEARQKAADFINRANDKIVVVTTPSVDDDDLTSTPVVRTPTPIPTVVAGDDKIIPNTGDDDTNTEEPIIQVNWDALNNALRKFWDSLRNIKIDLNPRDNK